MTDMPVERRRNRRHAHGDGYRVLFARVRPGHEVSIIDLSAGGVLVESSRRLLPGLPIELHLRSDRRSEVVRGRILRCAVARVRSNAICYRGAIAFDRHLPWFVDEESGGYAVPGAERRSALTSRVIVTRDIP